ncbi:FMN reductase (NADPH) [Priestia aryabhattai]|uniref:NADPH-dependent FMN reductase n=1 Tax=Priestia aryabhattai TaxID=412384 RepID=UPI000B509E32|nr:NADPH-dependent FMN reductase [Priestia aryabhattai]OVE34285.1 FMN reductase (NADPH) [Priestia aryabhattai]
MEKAVIIYGGNTRKSRLKGVLDKAEGFLTANGFAFETIFVHELPAEDLINANFKSKSIMEANAKVESADLIVIVTPVYKGAYSGILKTYLDLLPQKGFERKTVLPLVLGGSFGYLMVMDYALKPVVSALGATTVLKGAYVLDTQIQYAENDQFLIDPQADKRLNSVLETILEEKSRYSSSIHG